MTSSSESTGMPSPASDLTPDQSAWATHSEALWRRAHEIACQHPACDASDIYHALRCLELTPGQQGAARIVLTDQLSELRGTVAPIEQTGARSVVVFPENSAKWTARSRYIRRVEADSNGSFRIRGLPPGEQYRAFPLTTWRTESTSTRSS